MQIILYIAGAVCSLAMIVCCLKQRRPFRAIAINMLTGLAVLTLINILSPLTGVWLGVNAWTVGCSAVGGIPAIVLVLIVRVLWGV